MKAVDKTQNKCNSGETAMDKASPHEGDKTEEASSNISVLEDENGEQFKVATFEEMVMTFAMVQRGLDTRLSYIKNFPYQEGDVLVSSYLKTGTHWTSNLLNCLMYDGPLDVLTSFSPCLIDAFNYQDWPHKRDGNRIIASHIPPKRLPTEHFEKGGKTVVVFRNPKDTAVSMFHHMRKFKKLGEFKLSWNSYINYWMEGKIALFPSSSYFDYYNSWQQQIEQTTEQNVLVVQYEDLKKDSLNQLRRIQNYLGLNHSDERLQAVLDKCSFANLKAEVESGKAKTLLIDDEGKSILYRKGIIGDWKNHFTVAQNEKIETVAEEKFQNSMFNYKAWNC